jgi:hypothetical protein
MMLSVASGLPVLLRNSRHTDPRPPRPTSLRQTIRGLGSPITFTYDSSRGFTSLGRIVTITYNGRSLVAPYSVTLYSYEGSLSNLDVPGSVITYTYDANGRIEPQRGEGG